jgi:hypothetical protein
MINLTIQNQPNDETCGPTCLHAIYEHFNYKVPLDTLIQRVDRSVSGGTLAPFLALDALRSNFRTTIYVNNVDIFDPSWFNTQGQAKAGLLDKLILQSQKKTQTDGEQQLSEAYQRYLEHGGTLKFTTLSARLLKNYFDQGLPIMTGLSVTYLYRCPRECFAPNGLATYDDIRGTPCGHFVILCGYDDVHRNVVVADPARKNPLSSNNYYKVSINRLINAIMLGVLTYDANLLIIEPKDANGNHYCHG